MAVPFSPQSTHLRIEPVLRLDVSEEEPKILLALARSASGARKTPNDENVVERE